MKQNQQFRGIGLVLLVIALITFASSLTSQGSLFSQEMTHQEFMVAVENKTIESVDINQNQQPPTGILDILLKSKLIDRASFLIELKYTKDANVNLKELAQKGFQQILDKEYAMDMENVMKIGMAHCGKQVEIYVGKDAESIG